MHIYAANPWQGQGSLLDFDVQVCSQTAAGACTSWKTMKTITEPTNVNEDWFPTVRCEITSYYSERW